VAAFSIEVKDRFMSEKLNGSIGLWFSFGGLENAGVGATGKRQPFLKWPSNPDRVGLLKIVAFHTSVGGRFMSG
jgi:hypothetical protein